MVVNESTNVLEINPDTETINKTVNYELNLPSENENFSVGHQNTNMTKVDEELKRNADNIQVKVSKGCSWGELKGI